MSNSLENSSPDNNLTDEQFKDKLSEIMLKYPEVFKEINYSQPENNTKKKEILTNKNNIMAIEETNNKEKIDKEINSDINHDSNEDLNIGVLPGVESNTENKEVKPTEKRGPKEPAESDEVKKNEEQASPDSSKKVPFAGPEEKVIKNITENKTTTEIIEEEVDNTIPKNKKDIEVVKENIESSSKTPESKVGQIIEENQIEEIRKSLADKIEAKRPKTLWQKSLRIGKKILGNNAVKIGLGTTAAVAAVSVGGLGIVLTPLLFTAGVKYGVEGVVGLAQRHLFGGRKLENQVKDLNSKLEQNLSILKQFEQSNDQVFGKTKQIVEQEIKILNLNTEYTEANQKLVKWSKKHAFIRSIIGTVSTLGVGMVGGIPLGMQNFDGDSVKHMVRFSIRGFEYILNSSDMSATQELLANVKNILPFHTASSWGQVSHLLNWKSAFGAPNMWSLLGLGLSAGGLINDTVKKGARYFQSPKSSKNGEPKDLSIYSIGGDNNNETPSGVRKVQEVSKNDGTAFETQLKVNKIINPNIVGETTNIDKNKEDEKAEETTTTEEPTPAIEKTELVNEEKEEHNNSENKVEKEGIVKEEIPVESVEPIVFDSEFDDIKTFVHDIKNQRLVQGKRLAETEIYLEEIKSLDNTSYIADGIKNVCRKEIIKMLEGGKKFDLKKYQQDWEKAFHVLGRKEYWDRLMLEINNSKSIELILFASPDKLYVPKNTESDYEFIDQLKKNIEIAKQIKEYKDDEIMVIIKNDSNFYEGILKTVTQEFQEINKLYMNKNAELKEYIEKIKNKKHPVRMLKNKILNLFTTELFPNSTIGKKNLKKYYQHIIKSNNKKSIAFTKFDMIEFKYTKNEIIDRYLILSKTFETLYKENNDLNNEETNKVRNEATEEIIHLIREKDEKYIVKFLRDNLFEVFRLIRLSDRDKIVADIKSMTDIDPDKLSAVMNVVQDSYNKVLDRTQDPDGKNQPIKL